MKRSRPVICLVAVISLLISVIWHSPAGAASAPALQPLGQIDAGPVIPSAIDVDGAGNIYTVDLVSRAVVKLDPFGSPVASFAAGFPSGRGLAVTSDGSRAFVAGEHAVAIVDLRNPSAPLRYLAGSAAPRTFEFQVPAHIDVDRSGFVFVADAGAMQVKVYNASGAFQYAFGSRGTTAGLFKSQTGLAVDVAAEPQRVVIADRSLDRVQVFSLAGQVQATRAAAGAFGSTALLSPAGIAFDTAGRSYFVDAFDSSLRVLGSGFEYLATFTDPGLQAARDVAYDAVNGRLLVACETGIVTLGVDGGGNPVPANRAPGVPVPLSPVAGSIVTAAPALQFSAAADADGDAVTYEVQVAAAGEVVYSQATIPGGAETTTVAVPAGVLAENGSYTWQVRASDGLAASAWSDLQAFAIDAQSEAPSAPVAVSPLNGEAAAGNDRLVWQPSSDADPGQAESLTYRVMVGDAADAEFTPLQVLTPASEVALGNLPGYETLVPGRAYTWQVTAVDASGLATPAATGGSFVYAPAMVTVSANVPDARVYLDGNAAYSGRFAGVVPVEVRDLAPGAYSVVVERAGLEVFVGTFSVAPYEAVQVRADLAPALAATGFAAGNLLPVAVEGDAAPFVVDFDNDGFADLLVGDGAGTLTLYPGVDNGGAPAFGAGSDLGLPLAPKAVPVVVDWNNDGRKDLLVGAFDGTVKLFLNQGTNAAPAFDGGAPLATPDGVAISVTGGAAPLVADLDGDLDKDLLVGAEAGQLVLYRNQGTDAAPVLGAGEVLVDLQAPVAPVFVDLNGDGGRELLVAAGGSVQRCLPQADGTWSLEAVPAIPAFGSGQRAVVLSDLDGADGKDLLVGHADGTVTLALGAGTAAVPAFQAAVQDKLAAIRTAATEAGLNPVLASLDVVEVAVAAIDYVAALSASTDLVQAAAGSEVEAETVELEALLASLP